MAYLNFLYVRDTSKFTSDVESIFPTTSIERKPHSVDERGQLGTGIVSIAFENPYKVLVGHEVDGGS
jgi:hypothetical protein